jgi:hypothetical protein
VLVSYVNLDEYSEAALDNRLQDMRWIKERIQRHFEIVQQLAKQQIIIPMRFSTVIISEENLKRFISKYQTVIKQALQYFADKEEWTIKLYCNQENFIAQNMCAEQAELQSQLAAISPGKAYFLKKRNSTTLEEQSKEKINTVKSGIWEEVSALTEKTKINKNLSRGITERREEMILNAAFLIKKENLPLLQFLGTKLDQQLTGLNMYAEFVGPWPFYNFTELFIQE